MLKRVMIAAVLAASATAMGQPVPDPTTVPVDDPRVAKAREQLQKQLDLMNKQIEEMRKQMQGQGMFELDAKRFEMKLPEMVVQPIGVPGRAPPDVLFQVVDMGKKEKAAYLGMGTSSANATTREQLKLAKGMGLQVDFVDKDSPAAAVGLQQHDVVTKLDDQWLVNMQQLAVLVRAHQPGDSVKLTYVRGGEVKTVDVKLAEKELPVLDDAVNLQPFQIPLPGPGGIGGPRGDLILPRPDMDGGPAWQPAARVSVKTENGVTTRTMTDGEQTLTLTVDKDGKKMLGVETVKDHQLVFAGPVNTDDEQKKLPAGVAEKLKKLENDPVGGGVRLMIGGAGGNGNRIFINGNAAGNGAMGKMIVQRQDGDHTIRMETNNGDKHLTVKDRAGNVVFDGPVNTDEERKKVPEDVLRKHVSIEGKMR